MVVDSGYVLVAIKNTVSFNLLGLVGVVGKNGVAVFTLSAISNSIIIKPYCLIKLRSNYTSKVQAGYGSSAGPGRLRE